MENNLTKIQSEILLKEILKLSYHIKKVINYELFLHELCVC
jgi:hypothetical protein